MSTFEQVAVAFKNLRKLGYIARKRFACCGGCAGCAIANDVEKMPEAKRARILGAVFYTRQDADVGRSKRLAIAYGPVEVDEVGTFGRPAAEVGVALRDALVAAGCEVEWDGDDAKRIVVLGVQ